MTAGWLEWLIERLDRTTVVVWVLALAVGCLVVLVVLTRLMLSS